MAQPRPVLHVVVVHRGAPAEDVVADEEERQHPDHHRDQRDAEEGPDRAVVLGEGDFARPAERHLDQVVERPVPVVDRDADLDLEVGGEEDQRRAEDRPRPPGMRRHDAPDEREEPDGGDVVDVEPEERPRPEARDPDRQRAVARPGQPDRGTEAGAAGVPAGDAGGGPEHRRPEEDPRAGEE